MIKPYHDHVLVKLGQKSAFVTADEEMGAPRKGIRFGHVVDVPDVENMSYVSNYTWVAEHSIFNKEHIQSMHDKMTKLVGMKVWWEENADVGNEIEIDGEQYATIRFTKIIAVEPMETL